jgi:hypothetical protein
MEATDRSISALMMIKVMIRTTDNDFFDGENEQVDLVAYAEVSRLQGDINSDNHQEDHQQKTFPALEALE